MIDLQRVFHNVRAIRRFGCKAISLLMAKVVLFSFCLRF